MDYVLGYVPFPDKFSSYLKYLNEIIGENISEISEYLNTQSNTKNSNTQDIKNTADLKKVQLREILSGNPYIAFPTVGLFLVALSGNLFVMYLYPYVRVWTFLLASISSYGHFTVCHEGIHGGLSKIKILNSGIGAISSYFLGPLSSWEALKYCHLQHHMHTNDPNKDPDYWCEPNALGGKWLLPFRWATIDFYYWSHILRYIWNHPNSQSLRFILPHLPVALLMVLGWYYQFLPFLFWTWILPSRLALFLLSFGFDYLPHSNNFDIPRRNILDNYGNVIKLGNPELTTSYLSTGKFFRPIFSLATVYQNYHYSHHVFPSVPFFRYNKVWDVIKDEYLEKHGNKIVKRILPILGEEDLNVK
jgi:fatty acid desaturase